MVYFDLLGVIILAACISANSRFSGLCSQHTSAYDLLRGQWEPLVCGTSIGCGFSANDSTQPMILAVQYRG